MVVVVNVKLVMVLELRQYKGKTDTGLDWTLDTLDSFCLSVQKDDIVACELIEGTEISANDVLRKANELEKHFLTPKLLSAPKVDNSEEVCYLIEGKLQESHGENQL
jgi:hypothetical protein